MNTPDATTFNSAGYGATVGIQAEAVHNSNVYQVFPGDPPSRKYQVGVRYLENGVPMRARELIGEAIAHGYGGSEAWFHWVLAMLSKRSYRDLSVEDRERILAIPDLVHQFADDAWTNALVAIHGLLAALNDPNGDPRLALNELLDLPNLQRDAIVHHLDLVLTGGMKDGLWSETRQLAEEHRVDDDRLDRVWAYFEPEPKEPRRRGREVNSTSLRDLLTAVAASVVFVAAVGYLGWSSFTHAIVVPTVVLILASAAGSFAARDGLEWTYRNRRLRTKEREYSSRRWGRQAPESGFVSKVDHEFTRCFAKYVPDGIDREQWLTETVGIRRTLRDEVVEGYRESRVGIDPIKWLIRHMASDVRNQWRLGIFREYRKRYRVDLRTRIRCSIALIVLVPAVITVIIVAFPNAPFFVVLTALAAVVGGWAAAVRWRDIFCEHWRVIEDNLENDHVMAQRWAAHQRWKARLDSTRPSESQMESWLNCDKTLVLDEALSHYRLAWHEIIAHTFLLTPAKNYKRGRDKNGPWRYSRYAVRLFLITKEGTRDIGVELDFEHAETISTERTNFRFEAVSSVNVTEKAKFHYILSVTLMNGPVRDITITDPEVQLPEMGNNAEMVAKMSIDTAGFTHTLHILEGIAAEGKAWFDRERMHESRPSLILE